jgi:membrane protein DedA with SNARE-associated domain
MTQRALATPPVAYFLALMAAGCGVPVSEDALCVFVGAVVWPFLQSHNQRRNIVLALYLGVVGSDWVTFWIGRMMRSGILAPLAKKLNLNNSAGNTKNDTAVLHEPIADDNSDTNTSTPSTKIRPKTAIQERLLKRAGRWAGFVIRFSVGTRGPLMLMTGFSKQVPFLPFALGASVGAMVTVPLQLYIGYILSMRGGGSALNQHHPANEASAAAALAVVAGISTFVLGAAIVLTTATVGSLVVSQLASKRKQRRQQQLLSKTTNNTNTAV